MMSLLNGKGTGQLTSISITTRYHFEI